MIFIIDIIIDKILEQLSFGVGRLVGSPSTRSPSPAHSLGASSPRTTLRDQEIDIDVEEDEEEDEEVDVDVEEVGEEEEREANLSLSPRSNHSTPSPSLIRGSISPPTRPQKKFGDTFSVSALLRPDPPSTQRNSSSISPDPPSNSLTTNATHHAAPSTTTGIGLYPPLHLQGGLLPPHPHHALSYLHPQLLPHHLLPPHLHPLLRGVHPAHQGLHSSHGLHHPHPLGDVYSCVKCDKMFSTPHGLEVSYSSLLKHKSIHYFNINE